MRISQWTAALTGCQEEAAEHTRATSEALQYQEDVGKFTKLAYRVAFPLKLRLFNTVDDAEDPDRLYELFAIVVHIGTYVCQFVKRQRD